MRGHRSLSAGARPMRVKKSKPAPKTVNVTCATADGYRWLRRNLIGAAIQTPNGFVVTNPERWSQLLSAAGGKEDS